MKENTHTKYFIPPHNSYYPTHLDSLEPLSVGLHIGHQVLTNECTHQFPILPYSLYLDHHQNMQRIFDIKEDQHHTQQELDLYYLQYQNRYLREVGLWST